MKYRNPHLSPLGGAAGPSERSRTDPRTRAVHSVADAGRSDDRESAFHA